MPRPLEFRGDFRRGEKSLPLEGKLAQRQLRLMRSKLKIITMGWYKIATFDLIRSGLSRTTFPKGRLFFPHREILQDSSCPSQHPSMSARKRGRLWRMVS